MVLFLCYTLDNRGLVMRRKNGFIATTLIYSFLLLFATLVIVIIGNYTYYRSTINAYNKGINDSLNNLIDTKYVTLTNLVILRLEILGVVSALMLIIVARKLWVMA